MLTERQLAIFKVIIDDFIETAQPVGSKSISEKEHITLSAATVRNVMAELEEMGFLEKTHISSGRVPSEKGYRYYVDHLITPTKEKIQTDILGHLIQDGIFEFEQVVQMSAQILSDLTNYTSIILGPEIYETKLKQLQIVSLTERTAVAILVTNTGHVEHRSFTVPDPIKPSDLEKMANILNEQLKDVLIADLTVKLNSELLQLMRKYIRNVDHVFKLLKEVLYYDQPIKIYIGGKSKLLSQPEFKDVEKVRSFFSIIENEEEIINLLKDKHDGLQVTIGNENEIEAIKDFSLITSPYEIIDNHLGTIALIGPMRMEYRKVIRVLNTISEEMTNAFEVWYKGKG